MKSRHRVKTYGEVFTPRHMVDRMLDLVREELETGPDFVDKTFLEPAAGDGNFLVAILHRKLHAIEKRLPGRGVAGGVLVRARLDLRHRAAGGQPPGRQGRLMLAEFLQLPRRARCPMWPGDEPAAGRGLPHRHEHRSRRHSDRPGLARRGDPVLLVEPDCRGPRRWFSASRSRSPRCVTTTFDFTVYDSYAGVPDRQGPRGGEGRCLVRRSARSARSPRSSTPGRRRTSPSTTGGRRSATPSRRAQTRASRSRPPSCPSRRRRCGRGGRCSPPRPAGASRTRTSTPTCKQQGVERETTPQAHRVAPLRDCARRRRWSTSTTSPARTSPTCQRWQRGRLRPASRAAGGRRPSRGRLRRPGRPRCCGTPSRGSARR